MTRHPLIAPSLRWLGCTLGLACLGLSCSEPKTRITTINQIGRALPQKNAVSLLAQIRRANDTYRTIKSIHRVALEIALDQHRSEKRTFRGVIAIERPDRFRLHILGPMGIKLIDLLFKGGQARVIYLAEELTKSSRIPAIIGSIAADISAIYRLDPQIRFDALEMEESVSLASGRAPLYELKALRGERVVRQMTIFAATLAIALDEQQDDANNTLTITYGDYERHDQVLMPRSIHLAREGTLSYWLSISVESVQLNQKLDHQLFIAE